MKRAPVLVLFIALTGCSPNQEQASPKPAAPVIGTPNASSLNSAPAKPDAGPPQFTITPPEQVASLSVSEGGKCSVDSVNSKESDTGWTVHSGEIITVSGWVLDLPSKTTSDWAVLRLDAPDGTTRFFAPSATRGERADLVKAFGDGPGVNKATFIVVAATGLVPPASYKFAVLHKSAQGGQACTLPKTLNIVQ